MTRPVLLAYDGSPGARHAIEVAGRLFGGGPAVVVHLHEPVVAPAVPIGAPGAALGGPVVDPEEDRRQAARVAAEGCRAAEAAGFTARARHAVEQGAGSIADAIADVAEDEDARVIVVGADRRSRLVATLLGSVSEHLARHGARPVLIVPPSA